jgi:hypothetical protein
MALVTNGLYVNSLDAQDDYLAKNKLPTLNIPCLIMLQYLMINQIN